MILGKSAWMLQSNFPTEEWYKYWQPIRIHQTLKSLSIETISSVGVDANKA